METTLEDINDFPNINQKELFIVSETTTHFVIRLRNGKFGIGVYRVSKGFLKKMIKEKGWEILKEERIEF